jgi:hypothetical protein
MAFQAVPNVAQIKCEGIVDGCQTINNLYFELSGGAIDPVNIQTITGLVGAWFASNLAPDLSNNWAPVRAVGIDLGSPTGATASVGLSGTGGVTNEAAPNNVAACISLRTAQRGRSGHGRNFIPGVPNSLVTLNTMDSGFIANMTATYQLLVGAGTFAAGWQFCVVSRQTAGSLRAVGLAIPIVDVLFTTPFVRSMRSREVGRGA